MQPDELQSDDGKPLEGNQHHNEGNETMRPLSVPIATGDVDGLTDEQRSKINDALATVHPEVVDADARQLMSSPYEVAQRKRGELAQRREAKEISPHDFDLNFIFRLNEIDAPLTRKDLVHETGNQAVVISREDLETLGCVDFIHSSGERMVIEPSSLREGDVLILYPEELGDKKKG